MSNLFLTWVIYFFILLFILFLAPYLFIPFLIIVMAVSAYMGWKSADKEKDQ